MARNDANPPMPDFAIDYQLQEVDPSYLTASVKPKQFLHIDQAIGTELPGLDPADDSVFIIDDDVCTRCALCVDRCPTGVIILGKITAQGAAGDPHTRTNRHGYSYGVRF